ncbi:sialate O-acetylesterase [Pontibacter beigongshangensis]|uniref:sialate O-acetylesterase n=1 Tax=Pontibacter beigongshangensis TaxID=2574733 RepID=UPI0019D534E6|nr:sialate O-acetylesterase [Pontibacter beigongshangensis]
MNLFFCALFVLLAYRVQADVALPKILQSNMVLQRDKPLPVWGTAAAGEEVTVTFGKQEKRAKAGADGKWQVVLDPLQTSATPAVMTIAGTNTIRLENLLVGEVWLCSGQSNMEFTMNKSAKYADAKRSKGPSEEEIKKIDYPNIRVFLVKKDHYKKGGLPTAWEEADYEAVKDFSAPGFFFAEKLHQQLNIPIGIIAASVSGSHIERWAPEEALKGQQGFDVEATKTQEEVGDIKDGKFYYGMIQPLAPFAMRGFLWYQGETNCFQSETFDYTDKMEVLINTWRHIWKDREMPFYYVQIAPFAYSQSEDKHPRTTETLPAFWEAQAEALKIPNTEMIVTTDLVDSIADIHPTYKWEIGRRLANVALAKSYSKKVVYAGPVYKQMKVKGKKAVLEFDHIGSGLTSYDGQPLSWFTVAGADGTFVPAKAVIKGRTVVVSAPGVKVPVAVRFAWHEAAQSNFFNKEGLPARPFRTDAPEWQPKL